MATKDTDKDAPKVSEESKPTEDSPVTEDTQVVTPEAPTVEETPKGLQDLENVNASDVPNPDTEDVLKAHDQNVARATAQDAPAMGVPMGAVNEAEPTATENRFSGLYPNNTYPLVDGALDEVQEKRKQARDEGARTRRVSDDATPRAPHPPLAEKFTTNDHAVPRAEAEAEAEDVVA